MLVDFFEKRIDDDGMIALQPEDGEHVDRIIPESARLKFIEAVRYRLQRTPREALTPVHLLTLKCQRLGLNKFGCENPIVAALSDSTAEAVIADHAGQQFGTFKPSLADLAVAKLAPISGEMARRVSRLEK